LFQVNKSVLSLLQKQVNNSAILTSAGSLFHHCSARTEKSWDLAERCLPVLSEGRTSGLAKVVEWSARPGAWGLTNAWREVGAVPLKALQASTNDLNLMRAITGSQWRSRKRGVTWEHFGNLNTRHAAMFWMSCKGLTESSQERIAVVKTSLDQDKYCKHPATQIECAPPSKWNSLQLRSR